MTSAQRIFNYTKLAQEDDHVKTGDPKRGEWPSKGQIEFDDVTMRYREFLDPAIKNLSFSVQSGMKVGIVGRTGSGKSSILQVLFRLVDIKEGEGKITIDGIDAKSVGLHLLRQSIGFIP